MSRPRSTLPAQPVPPPAAREALFASREWFVVRCLRCGHQWDESDPESEVCACLDTHGERKVEVVSAGASNV